MTQTIKINGKDYPFALTFGTLARLKRDHKITNIAKLFSDIDEGGFEPFCIVVFEGIVSGAGREGSKLDLTYEQFAEAVDVKDMTILVEAISKSMGYEAPKIEEGKAEEVDPNEDKRVSL
jgi:hypothetical protein